MRLRRGIPLTVIAAVLVAGCGGTIDGAAKPSTLSTDVAVIKGWAHALMRGDINAAAGYFALPSVFVNGVGPSGQMAEIRIVNTRLARAANATLTCGAAFVSARKRGRYIDVLFKLTGRPGTGGTDCEGGVGATAQTDFLITNGKIAAWIRGPDLPQGGGSTSTTPNGEPSTTGHTLSD